MAYSTLKDLKLYMSEDIIIQLSDDRETGDLDVLVVDDCIERADTFIDGFLNGRYPSSIPEGEVPNQISDISTKLTAYNLYRRRMQTVLPEAISKDYKLVIKMLGKIQDGSISPFPSTVEPQVIITNKTAASRDYTARVWDKY